MFRYSAMSAGALPRSGQPAFACALQRPSTRTIRLPGRWSGLDPIQPGPGGRDVFEWITDFLKSTGYAGIALLMLLENVFPPVPSELIMPLAGFNAKQGDQNIVLVVLAGTVGSVLGALLYFYLGRWLRGDRIRRFASRYGRWLTVSPSDIDHAQDWFCRHGAKAVLVGRLIPAVRTLISVPAGIADMPLGRFLLYTTLGSVTWTSLLAAAGYLLADRYRQVSTYLDPVSNGIVVALVAWYLYRVWTFRPSDADRSAGSRA
jgi:membrane protein DedA with SNARE-associated domain